MTSPSTTIRPMTTGDWPSVSAIYEAGIATGDATFEMAAPSLEQWHATHLEAHRFVAVDAEAAVVGWSALSPVSDRCVYVGVAENSVYVDPAHRGSGVGRRLLEELVTSAESANIWTIQTGIFPENTASLTLHERCRFRVVGRRERIGQLDGRWRDTLFLERRSNIAG